MLVVITAILPGQPLVVYFNDFRQTPDTYSKNHHNCLFHKLVKMIQSNESDPVGCI